MQSFHLVSGDEGMLRSPAQETYPQGQNPPHQVIPVAVVAAPSTAFAWEDAQGHRVLWVSGLTHWTSSSWTPTRETELTQEIPPTWTSGLGGSRGATSAQRPSSSTHSVLSSLWKTLLSSTNTAPPGIIHPAWVTRPPREDLPGGSTCRLSEGTVSGVLLRPSTRWWERAGTGVLG